MNLEQIKSCLLKVFNNKGADNFSEFDTELVEKENSSTELTEEEKRLKFKSDLKFCVYFTIIFSLFRFFVYDWYIIPSSSMVPTLLIGDMPFVEKFAYGYSKHSIWFSPNLFSGRYFFRNNVKRGEIIVFKHPHDELDPRNDELNLIKRVIALPGDRVKVENGVISVNGVKAQLRYKEEVTYVDYSKKKKRTYVIKRYEEKLPLSDAPVHVVGYIDERSDSIANHFDEVEVPEGHYFVMGDNRDCSKDSRCGLGFVPAENLIGRAIFKVFSIDNGVRLWEFWRWLQNIRYSRILRGIE